METEAGEVETTDQCCSVRLWPHERSGSRTERGGMKAMRERKLVNIGQVDDTISFYRPQFRESFHASANESSITQLSTFVSQEEPMAIYVASGKLSRGIAAATLRYATAMGSYSMSFREERDTFGPIQTQRRCRTLKSVVMTSTGREKKRDFNVWQADVNMEEGRD
ncbi:hypothetical protein DY000_02010192 [Brassica cretica]|uniref:Uncharacterized protein n=1 Tax=Brassica cretica TaxID=69181 RepID=A0ABQ7CAV7_BRACR|nr:hypothetical protein DY000_02010192 [Brassica cretica]